MEKSWYKQYPKLVRRKIEIPPGLTLDKFVAQTCRRYRRREALVCMGQQITFEQLERRAEDFKRFLISECEFDKGDRMAIVLPNVIQFPIVFLGALKAGGVCVNNNPLYTPRELKHQLIDSGSKVIVILDLFLDKLEEIIDDTNIEHVIVTGIGDQLSVWKGPLVKLAMKIMIMKSYCVINS